CGASSSPRALPRRRELEYASRKLTAIEINGTFYSTQKPESFRKWAAETPDDFVFSLKAPRFATHRRVLAEAGESIERFFSSGVTGLKGTHVAISSRQEIRTRRLRGFSCVAAAAPRWQAPPPCGRGAARELSGAGVH